MLSTFITGRVLAIQRIMVGGVEKSIEGVESGGKVVPYTAIRGANGNDATVNPSGGINTSSSFVGAFYENEETASNNDPFRLEISAELVNDAIITISLHDALVGDATNQRFSVHAGSSFSLSKLDVSTMYIKNATPGSNTKVNIIGVGV